MVVSGLPPKAYYTGTCTGGQKAREKKGRGKEREGGINGHKLNVGIPVSLQPAHLINEYSTCHRLLDRRLQRSRGVYRA